MTTNQIITGRLSLFATALLQVSMVSANVVFISQEKILSMAVTGFLISLFWTLNVKKAAFGSWTDRVIYSSGAMAGTIVGYSLTKIL